MFVERHGVPRRLDPFVADRSTQGRKRAPERPPGSIGIVPRPEELTQRLSRARAIGERKVSEQGDRLARVEAHRFAIALHSRRAEKSDLHCHHRDDTCPPAGFRNGSRTLPA